MTTPYHITELTRAADQLRGEFRKPGATIPDNIEEATRDPLWNRLLQARAAANRYNARQAATGAGLSIHHGAQA